MIELPRVKLPKKFGFRNRNRIFHHRATEDTERTVGGLGVSPLEPRGFSFGFLGVWGRIPQPDCFLSLCPLWLCGEKVRSSEFGIRRQKIGQDIYSAISNQHSALTLPFAIYDLYGRINCYPKRVVFIRNRYYVERKER